MWNPELVIQYSGRHSTPDVPPDEGRVVLSEADISSTTSPYVCSRTCAAARGFTVVYAALVAKVALSPLRAARGGRGGGCYGPPDVSTSPPSLQAEFDAVPMPLSKSCAYKGDTSGNQKVVLLG